jgi:hypothetical protein
LKQLQLIQILCIKAPRPGGTALGGAKACRVNSTKAQAKRPKAASGNADTAFRVAEMENCRVPRFTAR